MTTTAIGHPTAKTLATVQKNEPVADMVQALRSYLAEIRITKGQTR